MTRNERLAIPRLAYYTNRQETRVELMRQLLNGPPEPPARRLEWRERVRDAAARVLPRTLSARLSVAS